MEETIKFLQFQIDALKKENERLNELLKINLEPAKKEGFDLRTYFYNADFDKPLSEIEKTTNFSNEFFKQ